MESDYEPLGKAREISTASTAVAADTEEDLQNNKLLRRRYLRRQSITAGSRSITYGSTDRTISPQISTLLTVRAMRAVICWVL
jgi:hypothetical protein